MHEITVESTLGDLLGQLAEQVILRDSSGRALGYFSPLSDAPRVDELQLEPLLSVAETETLRQNPTGQPLSDILARLGVQ